jgi:hypothetical protein
VLVFFRPDLWRRALLIIYLFAKQPSAVRYIYVYNLLRELFGSPTYLLHQGLTWTSFLSRTLELFPLYLSLYRTALDCFANKWIITKAPRNKSGRKTNFPDLAKPWLSSGDDFGLPLVIRSNHHHYGRSALSSRRDYTLWSSEADIANLPVRPADPSTLWTLVRPMHSFLWGFKLLQERSMKAELLLPQVQTPGARCACML